MTDTVKIPGFWKLPSLKVFKSKKTSKTLNKLGFPQKKYKTVRKKSNISILSFQLLPHFLVQQQKRTENLQGLQEARKYFLWTR